MFDLFKGLNKIVEDFSLHIIRRRNQYVCLIKGPTQVSEANLGPETLEIGPKLVCTAFRQNNTRCPVKIF